MRSVVELETGVLDVDTVEEGTQVLVLDDGGLLDAGADLGHLLEVDALKGQVVLLLFLSGDEDTFGGVDSLVDLETQEVLDLEGLAAVEDVDDDREMGVGEDHAELVADGDSGDHVADDAAHGTEHCVSLLLLEPHAELESGLAPLGVLLADLEGDVAEALGQFAERTLDGDGAGLDFDADSFGDLELLFRHDVLHCYGYY